MRFNTGNKILPVALVAALLGGTVGAFVGRTNSTTQPAEKSALGSALTSDSTANRDNTLIPEAIATNDELASVNPQYRAGFLDGFRMAGENERIAPASHSTARTVVERPVYRTTTRRSRSNASRQVYYDYNTQPRKRSFWQKHRDKLTVAMGTGGGALVGGLLGGKKGAIIGALAGAGGSALYTYKIRKRDRRY